MPDDLDNEIRYSNHILVTFSGVDFIVTFLQVRPPHIVDDDDRKRFASKGEIIPQLVDQFAVPAAQFVSAIDSINDLIERMREIGALPRPEAEGAEPATAVDNDEVERSSGV